MLENITGQQHIKELIGRTLKNGTAAQSYILSGESGMGKKTVAYSFAAALVCEHKTGCGECTDCKLAAAKTHPDIITVLPQEGKKTIGVDSVRTVTAEAAIKPYRADKKIVVLNGEITAEAQNALLKIIEEPPEYMVFIFLTESDSAILDTVKSRSIVLRLAPYSRVQMDIIAAAKGLPGSFPGYVYAYAGGNIGKALKLAADEDFKQLRGEVCGLLFSLVGAEKGAVLPLIECFEQNKDNADTVFEIAQSVIRDIIMYKCGAEKLVQNADITGDISAAAKKAKTASVLSAMQCIFKYRRSLKSNVNYAVLSAAFSADFASALAQQLVNTNAV